MSKAKQTNLGLTDTTPVNSVEEFKFEPIKGFPVLNWQGKRPFTSTKYYPAQLREVHGEDVEGWRNKIFWGDNLQVMSHLLKDFRKKINLIYIDPPFDSGAVYRKRISLKGEMIQGDVAVFEEKQYTDLWSNDEYLQFIYERLILLRELLADDGTLLLHCDPTRGHYIKLILDEIFGHTNFRNEIIWTYSGGAIPERDFPRKHDTIFRYCKSSNWTFNTVYRPYNELTAQRMRSVHKGVMVDVDRGTPVTDWWTDIKVPTGPRNTEKNGYPTQKPLALLKRIITVASNPGDIIFDAFMGSGTTLCAAEQLGRRYIGSDINYGAVQITTKRLLQEIHESDDEEQTDMFSQKNEFVPEIVYKGLEVYNVNHYDIFRNPIEARELLLNTLEINLLPQGQLFDGEKDGRMIKIMPVNRIATRADLGELIAGLDLKAFEKRHKKNPNEPVERITLVCMGHEPDLKASLMKEAEPYKLDVEVVDILRDRQDLQFKRDSEAKVVVKNGKLVIERFYPMNLLGKLSLQKEKVKDWRELVESVMIDWNYDGAILSPATVDIPEKDELVSGAYPIPKDAGTIRVKITDLLSESLEVEVENG